MKTLFAVWLLTTLLAGALPAASPAHKPPPPKNHTVALLAGAALHLAQNARALQSAALKRREKDYGRDDPQVKAGRKNLRVIRHKQHYFRQIKRHSEGRKAVTPRQHKSR